LAAEPESGRGIHRSVANRYADEVNKREAKADGNSGKPLFVRDDQ
jgi:hypothetical protein